MLKQVIVIGGGLSGLSAAHTVLEHGGKVILLDKNPFCGGNSTKATSGINASLTKTQLRKGIDDSAESFERDTARSANLGKSEETYPLAKVLTKESDPGVEWLTSKFGIDLSLVSRLGGHTHPRTHRGKERFPGMTITYALMERLEEIEKLTNGVDAKIITKAKTTQLLTENNNVIGAEYEKDGKKHHVFGVVIIATGGFAADYTDSSLLKQYRPDLEVLPTTNGNHCTGDGIKMALNVGGDVVDMEWVQVHPTGLVHPNDPSAKVKWLAAEALRGVGGILLDANGNRFCDELGRRDYVTGEMNKNKGPFRLVLNGKAGKEIEWHCKHYIGRKLMKKFNSGAELAKEFGISEDNLKATFEAYNEAASKSTDQYGKKFFTNAPFHLNEVFYVSVVTPVVHYCMGGVKISVDGEVLGKNNEVIPGLYAAGEVTGGVHGKNRLGGNSLLECVVFGRVSGRTASKYLLKSAINEKTYSGLKRVELVRNQLKGNEKNVPELLKLESSNTQSRVSGGTADILPKERAKTLWPVTELTEFLNGGKEATKRRKFLESVVNKDPELFHDIYNFSRQDYLSHGVNEFIRIHKPYKDWKPTRWDICVMAEISTGYGALNNSHNIFAGTIAGQGNEEQQRFWMPKIWSFQITGSYAQTELGHGSNVRGLMTTAEYDKSTDEFVLNTPTLRAMKWWPGCLGKVATHCVLYAQTIIDGKEHGVDVFLMQIRDENHLPLPGIRLGDLGMKMGDNANDTGFMLLENVRIPRTHMMSKYRTVTKEGKYTEVIKADPKVHYTTMMTTRAQMVNTAAGRLAQSATMAIRYSCVREQGFESSKGNVSYTSKEKQVIDHKIQQYRLFKQLAHAYALKFTARWMIEQLQLLEGNSLGVIKNTDVLKEVSAASAGLKSLTTIVAINGIEDCRKCCGGNGYLLNSGIGALSQDYLWQVTAEGDFIILGLYTARHLLKSVESALKGHKVSGVLEYLNVCNDKDFNLVNHRPASSKFASDFQNLNYLKSLFKYNALEKLVNIAKEFQHLTKTKNLSFDDAWNTLSDQLLKVQNAHSFFIIMNNFVSKVHEITNPSIQKALARLCALFACSNFIDNNWGDILEREEFRLINEAISEILVGIRPDCISLVDAFDYPDNVLRSTIGRYDGNVYEALFDAAQKSTLNKTDPFDGYEKYLKPHLNKDLLKHGNKSITTFGKL